MKKVTISRFEPMSVGKILAVIYGVIGLIIGVVYGLVIIIVGIVGAVAGENPLIALLAIVGGIVLGALFAGFYVLVGLLVGLISAGIYNIAAKKVGGVQIETL